MSEMTELQQAVTVGGSSFCNHIDEVSSIYIVSGRERDTGLCPLSWQLSGTRGVWPSGNLLPPKRLIFFGWNLRNSGDGCDCSCDGHLPVEAEHADLHGFRHDSVYGSGPDGVFINRESDKSFGFL